MAYRNPFAARLSGPQLLMAPSQDASTFVRQLLAKGLQNNGRGSRSVAESLDIAAQPIVAALLGKKDQATQLKQQEQQKALANQLVGGAMRTNIPLENVGGLPADNYSVPTEGPSGATRSALAGILAQNPQAMSAMAMQQAMPPKPEAYTLGPGQGRFQGNQQIASMPAAPSEGPSTEQLYKVAQSQGYKGSLMDYQKEIARAGASNINAAPSGYQWTPDGKLASIPGGPADPANRPPNEVQQKNLELVGSLNDANDRINAHEKAGLTDTSSMKQAALDSNPVTATMTDSDYRKYKAAALQWSANLLYLKSGATANPAEIQNTWREYFPQPNDPPDVKKAKADARQSEVANARDKFGGKPASRGASGGWSITPVQ